MHNDPHESFRAMVAADAKLTERYRAASEIVRTAARDQYGVELAPESVAGLASVRIGVLSDGSLGDYSAELAKLPEVRKEIERRAMADRLAAGDAETLSRWNAYSPERRISEARRQGVASQKAAAVQKPNPADEAEILAKAMQISNPGRRLAFCRQHGIGV